MSIPIEPVQPFFCEQIYVLPAKYPSIPRIFYIRTRKKHSLDFITEEAAAEEATAPQGGCSLSGGDSGIPGYKGSIPLLLLYDRKGRFVRSFVGWGEGSLSSVRAAVEEAL